MALNSIILAIVSESFRNSARRAAPTIEEYIVSLYNGGLDANGIKAILLGPRGEELIFGPLRRAFGYTASKNMERTRQETRDRIFNERLGSSQLYSWILGPVQTEHCEDCLDRAARGAMTMREWELIGVPKSGTTKCNVNCNCKLNPVK